MIKQTLAVFAIVAIAAMMGASTVAPAYAAILIEEINTQIDPPTFQFYQTICNVYPVFLTLSSFSYVKVWDNNKEERMISTQITFTDTVGDTIGTGTSFRSELVNFHQTPVEAIVVDNNQFSCSNGETDIDVEINEFFGSTTTYNLDGTITYVSNLVTDQPAESTTPPTISATATSPIDEDTSTLLDGTAVDPDGDDLLMTYSWDKTSGQGGSIDNDDQLDATFNAPKIGGQGADRDYVFTLTVTDESGEQSTTTVNLTVVNSG